MFFYLALPLGSDAPSLALSDVAGTPLFQPQGFALASVVALYPMSITVCLNYTLLRVILFPEGQNQESSRAGIRTQGLHNNLFAHGLLELLALLLPGMGFSFRLVSQPSLIPIPFLQQL